VGSLRTKLKVQYWGTDHVSKLMGRGYGVGETIGFRPHPGDTVYPILDK
jgi:hypothetical protein